MKNEKIPKSFGTHDGTFHADEVTACALLLLFDLIDEGKIHRTRDRKVLDRCEYVCDVGGYYDPNKKYFDHHQVDYQGPMSSAGMVLLHLQNIGIVDPKEYDFFNQALIIGVDAHDNGKDMQLPGHCSYSYVMANFAPIPYDPPEEVQNKAFKEALHFGLGHLRRLWQRYQFIQSCRDVVKEAMKERGDVIIFEKGIPWMPLFFDLGGDTHPAKFVIMPSGGHWNLRGIPPNFKERMSVRLPLPEKWAGLLESELEKLTKIQGSIFCHKGRFISVWETKEAALQALDFVLKGVEETL